VNEQEQDRYEAELRRAPPARLPEPLMARLRAAKPAPEQARTIFVRNLFCVAQTSKSAVPRVSRPAGRHGAAPTWKSAITAAPIAFGAALRSICSLALTRWHLWRWLGPAVVVGVAGWLVVRVNFKPGNSAEKKPSVPVFGMKADDVHVDEELVSSYDVVAKLPGGEPVRFRCRQWRDQWSVTDTNRGVEIVQNNPRVEVVPVRFETY